MRTWDDYKDHVKSIDEQSASDIEEMETMASIIGVLIEKRNALGLSQRDLAKLCGLPQSSIARVEAMRTTPKLDTLLKMMKPLGLKLNISMV